VVARDLPYYSAEIPEAAIAGLNNFTQAVGLATAPVAYEDLVAVRMRKLWQE
jgi:hypothetical protein